MDVRSVLIIDNDREIVDLLSFYFEEHGYVVDTAIDGHTGVALAQLRKPQVVICDIVMDRMHGFEVVQKLRARPELAGTLIIMVSAKSYKPDIERARALGADHFVVKPFRCDELLALVEAGAAVATR
jgi:DNA-binding response OmpR family regulator